MLVLKTLSRCQRLSKILKALALWTKNWDATKSFFLLTFEKLSSIFHPTRLEPIWRPILEHQCLKGHLREIFHFRFLSSKVPTLDPVSYPKLFSNLLSNSGSYLSLSPHCIIQPGRRQFYIYSNMEYVLTNRRKAFFRLARMWNGEIFLIFPATTAKKEGLWIGIYHFQHLLVFGRQHL